MYNFYKHLQQTGLLKNENYSTPQLSSGLKGMSSTTYTTGTAPFVVATEGFKIVPTKDGRRQVSRLECYFSWDTIHELSGLSGLELIRGKTKLEFNGSEYRLVLINDYGQKYNRPYIPCGVIKAVFDREASHGIN